jgi:hypothetical protein
MKLIRKLLFIFCCTLTINTNGQCDSLWHHYSDTIDMKEIGPWTFEEMPQFPGGEDARIIFFKENVKFPPDWPADSIKGKVFTTFIVDEYGNIKFPHILRGINPILDSIAISVIKRMPKWSPAKVRGVSVCSTFNLPIIFGTDPKTKK